MSHDSHQRGYDRGNEDALEGHLRRQPGKLLDTADAGYVAYWQSYYQGFAAGTRERQAREAMEAAV